MRSSGGATGRRHGGSGDVLGSTAAGAQAPAAERLEALEGEVVACRACPRLVAWREEVARTKRAAFAGEDYWGRPVPGFGDPAARLLVVGLAPAAHGANRTGRMFTGDRSGEWLYRALWRAGFANQPEATHAADGLALTGAWVTSPVKCAPPANKPTGEEFAACRGFFEAELEALAAVRVVVALGGLACGAVARHWNLRPRPRFAHGLEVALPGDRTLLCCYHVSQQNTFTGRLTEEMLDAVFDRARSLAG
ncbi:MAG: uracil-DNA glycosylase [Acidimicrobiia bacterium]|nr:uracil-DNA glycosylase [Acidimicrobiia bacterium]